MNSHFLFLWYDDVCYSASFITLTFSLLHFFHIFRKKKKSIKYKLLVVIFRFNRKIRANMLAYVNVRTEYKVSK